MKTYNIVEFRDEVLKRTGWTEQQLEDYHDRKSREREELKLTDEDVEIYINGLKNSLEDRKNLY